LLGGRSTRDHGSIIALRFSNPALLERFPLKKIILQGQLADLGVQRPFTSIGGAGSGRGRYLARNTFGRSFLAIAPSTP